jgi:hypothetical protein
MLIHVVIWRLKDEALGADKATNAARLKREIEALVGVVPEIRKLEVGLNEAVSDQAGDVVLYSAFDDWDGLDRYQQHPAHQAVVGLVREIVSERRVVDYER